MRIRWLDAGCTEALLIRGVLWWRRVAHVAYKAPGVYKAREWQFVPSGDPVPNAFVKQLWSAAQAHRDRAREHERAAIKARNWQKPPPKRPYLPSALIVRRGRKGRP